MNVYPYLRPALFWLDPETAHHLAVETGRWMGRLPGALSLVRKAVEFRDPTLTTTVAGLHFENPIGLAAGWDKSGRALQLVESLGFGFAEIGSISLRPSRGNRRPRLFRLPSDRAIVVNYGLPNDGVEAVCHRLAKYRPRRPLGVNVVATNDGPAALPLTPEEIVDEYARCVEKVHRHARYLMLNLSCPNVGKGHGDVATDPGMLVALLRRLQQRDLACPVFLKVPPVEDPAVYDRWLRDCDPFPQVRGFCFNLSSHKSQSSGWTTDWREVERLPGAAAGKPSEEQMNRCIAGLYRRLDPARFVIIGAGGVFSAEDAYRKIRLGASLVQLLTALVYEGPGIAGRICQDLSRLLRRDGFRTVADAVGVDNHGGV